MGRSRPADASRHVIKYLAPGELVVLELKQHWARVLPAVLSCLLGLFLVLVAGFTAPASLGALTNAAWWVWLVLVLHLLWRIIEWRDETFVITDRRLLLVHGIAVKKVAMMPLSKVTDMSYNRSVEARLLGYGTFVMESAGQEQALSTVDYVREPDAIYRELCGLIFGEDTVPQGRAADHDDVFDLDADDAWTDDRWNDDRWADENHDRTLALPTRRRHERDVDDTDPYGMVTDATPIPRSRPFDSYAVETETGPHDPDDESAWSVSREHATRPQPVHRSRYSDPPV